MTTEERLENLERELVRAKRRNRWLLTAVGLALGVLILAGTFGPTMAAAPAGATAGASTKAEADASGSATPRGQQAPLAPPTEEDKALVYHVLLANRDVLIRRTQNRYELWQKETQYQLKADLLEAYQEAKAELAVVEKELEQAPKPDPVKLEAERQARRESENAAASRAAIEKERALQEAAAAVRQKQEQKAAPAISLPVAERLSPLAPETVFARASPAVVRIVVKNEKLQRVCQGSGFFVTRDGLVVTNHHVIKGATTTALVLTNGEILFVESVVACDEKADLAIVKVKGTSFACLPLAPAGAIPAIGAKVYAIGSPEGLTNTFSDGMVSGLRQAPEGLLIQTTAAISSGSSGGPLLDVYGCVLGVTSSMLAAPDAQNLNFAISCESIWSLLSGATSQNATPSRASAVPSRVEPPPPPPPPAVPPRVEPTAPRAVEPAVPAVPSGVEPTAPQWRTCPMCNGSGIDIVECISCGGTGRDMGHPCRQCGGRGLNYCPRCKGKGMVSD